MASNSARDLFSSALGSAEDLFSFLAHAFRLNFRQGYFIKYSALFGKED
jgi:hypothetical protein